MGQDGSKTNDSLFNQHHQQQELETIKHFQIGSLIKITDRSTNTPSLKFLKQYSYTSQDDYQYSYIKYLQKMQNLNQHVLSLEDVKTRAQNTFCSTFYKIGLIYEYVEYSLKEEIQMRIAQERAFDQKQVWSILCSCVLGMAHIERTEGRTHSALETADIRLTKEGIVKILSSEMLGISPNHKMQLGNTATLAKSILYCLNFCQVHQCSSQDISRLTCSQQLKSILHMMLKQSSTFTQLEQYLFKLVQDQQSLSISRQSQNTSILKTNQRKTKDNICQNTPKININNIITQTNNLYNCPRIQIDRKLTLNNQQDIQIPRLVQNINIILNKLQPDNQDQPSTQINSLEIQQQKPDQNQIDNQQSSQLCNLSSQRKNIQNNNNKHNDNYLNKQKYFQKDLLENKQSKQLKIYPQTKINKISYQNNFNNNIYQEGQQIKPSMIKKPYKYSNIDQYKNIQNIQHKNIIDNNKQIETYQNINKNNNLNISNQHINYINSQRNYLNSSRNNYSQNQHIISGYQSKNYNYNQKDHLFTDPSLLTQIKTDLQEIKIRKSLVGGSKKPGNIKLQQSQHQKKQKALNSNINIFNMNIPLLSNKISFQPINQLSAEYTNNSIRQLPAKDQDKKQIVSTQFKQIDNIMSDSSIPYRKNITDRKIQTNQIKNQIKYQPKNQFKHQIKHQTKHQFKHQAKNQVTHQVKSSVKKEYYQYKENRQDKISRENKEDKQIKQNKFNKENKISHDQIIKKQSLEYTKENYARGKYQGTKLNNMRHGHGIFYYSQGGKYVGEWLENRMHGHGTLYYPNQQIAYEGKWHNDQLCGLGTLYNEEVSDLRGPFDYRDWSNVQQYWIKYEGQFQNDNKNGKGKLFLVNGQYLQGQFKNDEVDGEGILHRKDSSQVRGLWRKNKLIRIF